MNLPAIPADSFHALKAKHPQVITECCSYHGLYDIVVEQELLLYLLQFPFFETLKVSTRIR
jgi:hypothetical protein